MRVWSHALLAAAVFVSAGSASSATVTSVESSWVIERDGVVVALSESSSGVVVVDVTRPVQSDRAVSVFLDGEPMEVVSSEDPDGR